MKILRERVAAKGLRAASAFQQRAAVLQKRSHLDAERETIIVQARLRKKLVRTYLIHSRKSKQVAVIIHMPQNISVEEFEKHFESACRNVGKIDRLAI